MDRLEIKQAIRASYSSLSGFKIMEVGRAQKVVTKALAGIESVSRVSLKDDGHGSWEIFVNNDRLTQIPQGI